jgi:uncharacterized protein YdaU (DUF1376 family)
MTEDPPNEKRKAPAFQLYVNQFLAGTIEMSQEEVGCYIRLLCHQWNRGSIPVEPDKLQRLAGGSVSDDVLAKFPTWPDGQRRNERLEHERSKQIEFREKQRQKGIASGLARRNQPDLSRGSTVVPTVVQPDHQPETNFTFTSTTTSKVDNNNTNAPARRFVPPTRDELDVEALKLGLPSTEVDKFVAYYGSNGWKVGKVAMKSWTHALAGWAARWKERSQSLSLGDNRYQTATADNAEF